MNKNWADEANETLKLHAEKQEEIGIGKPGRPDMITGRKGWGIRDTAKLMNKSVRKTVEDLHIAKWLVANPGNQLQHRAYVLNIIGGKKLEKLHLKEFLGILRTQLSLLELIRTNKKIVDTIRKGLKDYEG